MFLAAPSSPPLQGISAASAKSTSRYSLVLAVLYLFLALFSIWRFSFDWPRVDDFGSIDWYVGYFVTDSISLGHLLAMHDGSHPMGSQVMLTLGLFRLFGIHFLALIGFNALVVAVGALLVWLCCRDELISPGSRVIGPLAVVAIAFHPVQTNHLIWGFEMGWFLINLVLFANIFLLERYRLGAFPVMFILLVCGGFSSAQGAWLWLCVALHIGLLGRLQIRTYVPIAVTLVGFVANVIAIRYIVPSDEAIVHLSDTGSFVVYFISLLGGGFCTRDPEALPILGGITLVLSIVVVAIALRGPRSAIDRMVLVLAFGSLGFLLLFAKGRFQNGLPWALSEFHFGPLLVPGLIALALAGLRLSYGSGLSRKLGGLGVILFVAAGIVSSIPYMIARGSEAQAKQALAMHVTCNDGYSRYVVANLNLDLRMYDMLERSRKYLLPLCTTREPAQASAIERFPDRLTAMANGDPRKQAAFFSLWDVYMTHFDLQRAIPPSDVDGLLRFAKLNAQSGSHYAPEALGEYEPEFLILNENKN